MAPSFDCAASSLLCADENDSVFEDNDCCGALSDEFDSQWSHRVHQNFRGGFDGVGGGWLPLQSEEFLALLLEKEEQHLPNAEYLNLMRNGDLDLVARSEAVDWIGKVGSFNTNK